MGAIGLLEQNITHTAATEIVSTDEESDDLPVVVIVNFLVC